MSEAKNPHRFVTVGSSGETFLTIETNCLSGAPIGEREEATIRWAIDNLSGFVGDALPANKPPFIFRRYINGQERAEGIGVETVETLEEAMPIAVRLCPRRPSECAVLVLERLAAPAAIRARGERRREMGETQHTPTPWFAVNDGTAKEPMWSVKAARIAGKPPRHEVAICATGDSPQEMETANAAFIVHAVNSHATLTAALEEARGALEPFVAKMQKVEDQYRKRGGNPDSFPDTHPSFDISADSRELPLGSWRRARTALATIKAALGSVKG